jgi:glycosyltransferase involved in cell wall biosynthesis
LPFRERITVIHDGIDASVAAPNPAAALTLNGTIRLAPGDEVVTFVNRNLEPYRGYHTLMRALPEVLSRRPNARVVIVGGDGVSYGSPPPAGQTWRAIFWNEVATRVDPSRVHFVGSLPYEHYLALLQVSAAHVYLTYPFVLGWSCIEAMSVGCAIVGSDTPPVREVLRHDENALLVDFFDHGALADAVITLLGDRPMAARLGSAAREHVLRHYDLQTVCLPAQSNWIQTLLATATRRP